MSLDRLYFNSKFDKTFFMAPALQLDNEFMQYWLKLSLVQKESLLSVAKNFVQLKDDADTNDLRKKLILEERDKYLRGEGTSYSLEQVRQMALNKEKRNGL